MIQDLDIKQKDKYYLLFITIFTTVLVAYYIKFNINLGIYCSDVYVYLLNSIYYTGKNIHSTSNIYLSPVICFITSIFFRMGFVDRTVIYIVTGAFAILGNIGFYLLLKRYFNETMSLTGTIIYSASTLYLTWLANGTLDIPANTMTIWIVLFSIIAIKNNPKFYKYLFTLFVLGVFTRYSVMIVLPAIMLYYVYEKGFKIESEDKKYIIKGIEIAAILGIVVLAILLIMGSGQFGAGYQISSGIIGQQGSELDPAYNADESYYLMNLPNFISNSHTIIKGNPILDNPTVLSWAIFAILLIGAGLWLYDNKRKLNKKDGIVITLIIITIATFSHISSFITILLSLLTLFLMGKDNENKTGYFMAGWILTNFIFYSYYSIKVNRYILPVFPPLIYFILMGITQIHNHLKINKSFIPIILIVLFIIQAFAFTSTFDVNDEFRHPEEMSKYIVDNDPHYDTVSIGAYNLRPYSWWLGENVVGIVNSNQTAIDESNVTYYISNKQLDNLNNYDEIKNMGNLYLYKKSV